MNIHMVFIYVNKKKMYVRKFINDIRAVKQLACTLMSEFHRNCSQLIACE